MRKIHYFCLIFACGFLFLVSSCSKDELKPQKSQTTEVISFDTRSRTSSRDKEIEIATVLGRKRNNPYTVANMTAAYNRLYKKNLSTLPVTHRYVKFMPEDQDHLAILEDYETEELIAIFDFPLEYEIEVEGDFYVDPNVTDSLYTYQYATIPTGKWIPNVPHEILEELVIPPNNSYLTETAFYIAEEEYDGYTSPKPDHFGTNWDDDNDCTPGCENYPCCKVSWITCGTKPCQDLTPPCSPESPNWPDCLDTNPPPPPPGGGDPWIMNYCECHEYIGGVLTIHTLTVPAEEGCDFFEYYLDENNYVACQPTSAPPPPPPPPQALNACGCPLPANIRFPGGCVRVERSRDDITADPVIMARVKTKNTWFTSDVTFTNPSGCWQVNKAYSGTMWMWVKFKNNNCKVRAFRGGLRFWQFVQVVNDYVGRFSGPNFRNTLVHYGHGANDNESQARRYWASAHALNGDFFYRQMAQQDGIPIPRTKLNYLLMARSGPSGAPMLQGNPFGSTLQINIALRIPLVILSTWIQPDVLLSYRGGQFSNVRLNTIQYHELGHASHHKVAGETYWVPYRDHILRNDEHSGNVYGQLNNFAWGSYPSIAALGEAIGYWMESQYGDSPRGSEFISFNILGDDTPENFIPRGLMWDLIDTNQDWVHNPVTNTSQLDVIEGFTPAMIYNALTPNVFSISNFRDRLRTLHLSQTPNTQEDFDALLNHYDVLD
jgi:hypothetical protein